jgi:LPS-assembly protein
MLRLSLLLTASTGLAFADDTPPGAPFRQDATEQASPAPRQPPLILHADEILSISAEDVEARGRVEAHQGDRDFYADVLRYNRSRNHIFAQGDVHLSNPEIRLRGSVLELQLDTYAGYIDTPTYQFVGRPGQGRATRIDIESRNIFEARKATFSSCTVEDEDWTLSVADLHIDQGTQVGTARNALLTFKSVPLLYSPYLSFPLNDARKSGLLTPTIGTTGQGGLDIVLPYYFNLAPNYDATFYPRFISKRGLQLGLEGRYLLDAADGQALVEYLDNDQQANRSRWAVALTHNQTFTDSLRGELEYQRVSDDDYFRDLSNLVNSTSLSILPQQGQLIWTQGDWQANLLAQQFQVLQDPNAPITPPYNRLPQLSVTGRHLYGPVNTRIDSEFVAFRSPVGAVEGERYTIYPTASVPLETTYLNFTPKVGLHYTHYSLDSSAPEQTIDRLLPIASLDTGLFFERDTTFRGRAYLQTLEPRLYYVYVPYEDQSQIPVFDTALLDFNFAQMFRENQFIGGDRINDANQLTLALINRYIEDGSGLERLRVALGQRYYFASQQVTLPGVPPRDTNSTDVLLEVGGQINASLRVDTGWQFNTDLGRTIRNNIVASWRPAPGRAINVGYRFIDAAVEQVDFSAQWPLTDRLYGLSRLNYSLRDNRLVEGLAGLEYNGGCWALRMVAQKIATTENSSNNAFFLQLELNGLGRIGSNPLQALKQSIPGYANTTEILAP